MTVTARLLRVASRSSKSEQRDRLVELCLEALEMAPGIAPALPGTTVGRAARSGALILLDLAYPELDLELRDELARTCELVA